MLHPVVPVRRGVDPYIMAGRGVDSLACKSYGPSCIFALEERSCAVEQRLGEELTSPYI